MFKKIIPYTKKHILFAILAPVTIAIEVLLEIRIPKLMAEIVDIGIGTGNIDFIIRTGTVMVLLALFSMLFGMASAVCSSIASMGFGAELRKGIFEKFQDFSFANLDKFTTPSLITRITTDVNNTQHAYMMIIG